MTAHRIEPYVLFDPAREGPPPDAIDLQVRLPRSMQVWADDLARTGQARELMAVQELVEGLVPELVIEAQRWCGRVEHSDYRRSRGRLAITAVPEGGVPGHGPQVLPHVHLYLGATAAVMRDGDTVYGGGVGPPTETGDVAPVDLDAVADGAGYVKGYMSRALEERTAHLGISWGIVRDSQEIVDPSGLVERGEAQGFVTCPGPWGPRRLVLADAYEVRRAAEADARRRPQPATGFDTGPATGPIPVVTDDGPDPDAARDRDEGVSHLPSGGTRATPEVVARTHAALGLRPE